MDEARCRVVSLPTIGGTSGDVEQKSQLYTPNLSSKFQDKHNIATMNSVGCAFVICE
jgi:hypothetical protein